MDNVVQPPKPGAFSQKKYTANRLGFRLALVLGIVVLVVVSVLAAYFYFEQTRGQELESRAVQAEEEANNANLEATEISLEYQRKYFDLLYKNKQQEALAEEVSLSCDYEGDAFLFKYPCSYNIKPSGTSQLSISHRASGQSLFDIYVGGEEYGVEGLVRVERSSFGVEGMITPLEQMEYVSEDHARRIIITAWDENIIVFDFNIDNVKAQEIAIYNSIIRSLTSP